MYVYIRTEPNLWTVGHYDPNEKWVTDNDYNTKEKAAERCHYLNGGSGKMEKNEESQMRFCEILGNWYLKWMNKMTDNHIPHNLGFAKEQLKVEVCNWIKTLEIKK